MAEGVRPILDLMDSHPASLLSVVVTPTYMRRESDDARRARSAFAGPLYSCPDSLFARLSGLDNPQGILAVVTQPQWSEDAVIRQPEWVGLFGDGLQDPTNVGAIIRTAAALNAAALWLTSDSVDVYNPKVVRAASGTLLTLPVFRRDDPAFLVGQGGVLFAADASPGATVALGDIERVPRRLLVAVGNESRGLSQGTAHLASVRFRIPLSRGVESLNVAASTAIALFHIGRLPKTDGNEYQRGKNVKTPRLTR